MRRILLSSALIISLPINTLAAVPSSSISLPPNLTIPDEKDYVKEKPTYEDVQKTLNLEEIKLSYSSIIAELGMGVEANLGLAENEISLKQLRLYEQTISSYMERVEKANEVATNAEEIENIADEFREWSEAYKLAILKDRELEVEAKKQKAEEERARLAKIMEDEKALVKEIDSIIDETNSEMDTPEPDVLTDKISFAIPKLGRQYLTYMPHRTITSRSSQQWKLQQVAETNDKGYRTYKGMPLIALASSYGTEIGTVYDITFKNGDVLRAVLGDCKADAHTDSRKQYRDASGKYDGSSGNILEMILDDSKFASMGQANRLINGDYPTEIISIVKVGKVGGF